VRRCGGQQHGAATIGGKWDWRIEVVTPHQK
jgi:hypothetical protein